MTDDQLTYMTGAHLAVIKALEKNGLGVMEEIEFPPYRVDVYLPKYHAAVEVDGPMHSERADRRRDRELYAAYSLHVFHVDATDARSPKRWMDILKVFMLRVGQTRDERYEKAAMRAPWL